MKTVCKIRHIPLYNTFLLQPVCRVVFKYASTIVELIKASGNTHLPIIQPLGKHASSYEDDTELKTDEN